MYHTILISKSICNVYTTSFIIYPILNSEFIFVNFLYFSPIVLRGVTQKCIAEGTSYSEVTILIDSDYVCDISHQQPNGN